MKILLCADYHYNLIAPHLINLGHDVVNIEDYQLKDNRSKLVKLATLLINIKDIDILYWVGGIVKFNKILYISKMMRKKVIVHWIGSDLLWAQENVSGFKKIQKYVDVNLAVSKLLIKELKELGSEAYEVPIITDGTFLEITKMPPKHSAIVYLPEGKEDFYGIKHIEFLARKHPEVVFHITANSKSELIDYENVVFHGFLEEEQLNEIYDQVSILIRMTKHDGTPLMVMDAMSMGKYVMYSFKMPYVHTPASEKQTDILDCFNKILQLPLDVNKEASDFIAREYSKEKIEEKYSKILGLLDVKK